MLKMALLNNAVKEKCCSVHGGRGICSLFCPHPRGWFDSSRVPPQGNLPSKAIEINYYIRGSAQGKGGGGGGGGGGGVLAQLELTDA